MITKITGKLVSLFEERIILEIPPLELEVSVPEYTRRQLQGEIGKAVHLYTIAYIDGNQMQNRMIPRLLGFMTETEREFFELLCTVDGFGSKKALKAMVRPVREIAEAIEEQNVKFLAGLPGIGSATAERIVAKLRRKVPKFALMVSKSLDNTTDQPLDVVSETYEALVSLGHTEAEARRLIDTVLENSKKPFKDSAELIQAIYLSTR